MKLSSLLEKLEYTCVQGNPQQEVTGVVYDSRKVTEGSLFICIRGAVVDGHKFVPDVVAKGAKVLVVEEPVNAPSDVTVIQVADTRYAMAFIAAAWFGHPAEKLKTIGITGTKGKTTTTYMVKSILENAGYKVGLIGTIEAIIGDKVIPASNTTPESYVVQEYFHEMVEAGCDCVVMEVSSQGKLIGHHHHLNTAFYFGYLQGFQNILFGNLEMTADCNGCQGIVDAEFTWNVNFHREIHKSLQMVAKVKGRIEMVKVSDEFTLMIDYAHNAMALESLLTTLREYHPHRLVCLFGCGGNRSKLRRYEMGEVSGRLADLTIITSDNPRDEEPQAIIDDIKVGMAKTEGKYVEIPDRKEAIAYAIHHGEPGDIVVLAGKGHEDYQEIKGKKYPMDERVLIADILAGK